MVFICVYSFVARPGVQALGMLKIVLPDKYEDTIEFLDSSRSARTPGMTLTSPSNTSENSFIKFARVTVLRGCGTGRGSVLQVLTVRAGSDLHVSSNC